MKKNKKLMLSMGVLAIAATPIIIAETTTINTATKSNKIGNTTSMLETYSANIATTNANNKQESPKINKSVSQKDLEKEPVSKEKVWIVIMSLLAIISVGLLAAIAFASK